MAVRSKHTRGMGMILVLAGAVAARAQTAPPDAPTAQPAAAASRPSAAASGPTTAPAAATRPAATVAPEVETILDRIEKRDVADLRATVAWRQQYLRDPPDQWTTKRGKLWFLKAQPTSKFLIHFADQVQGDGTKRELDEKYMFDGRWYVEIQSRTKSCLWREVRKASDASDPYRVGKGLFPLPFGQKKADILAEFDVKLAPADANDPADTDHLRLLPREGTRTGESYRELHFWVLRGGALAGLPIKVRVTKLLPSTGEVDSTITITFADPELNTSFSGSVFDVPCPPGFTKEEERLDDIPEPPQKKN